MVGKDRFTKHIPRLQAFATALTGDAALAEDLVQEAYLRALRAKQMPIEEAAIRSWMFKILRHAFIDHLRRQRRLETFFATEEVDEGRLEDSDVWSAVDRTIDAITIRQAFQKLSGRQREILGLVDLSGLSYAEAAEVLEVPVGTVMSRVSRARRAMVSKLAGSNIVPVARRRSEQR
jgi:RNA polymerase sigma-70 factor (ECF subfamily)